MAQKQNKNHDRILIMFLHEPSTAAEKKSDNTVNFPLNTLQ